jgi:predicted metal-dependent hydrolase
MKYEVDGINYDVILNKKRIRNIYVRFKNNSISVSTPFLVSEKEIYNVLDKNIDFIRKMIQRENKKNTITYLGNLVDVVSISNLKNIEYSNGKIYVKDRFKIDDNLKILALPIFMERLNYIYSLFEEAIPFPQLKIRKMTSRWGVCNRKTKSITLNSELIKYDIVYIDYVIVHELSHFVHFNHSKSFWMTVSKYCPQYKMIRKKLRE